MDEQYKVVLKGLRQDVESAQATRNLASLFKASPEQIERVLDQANYVIKRGLAFEVAVKYKAAVEGAGGLCITEIEALRTESQPSRQDATRRVAPPQLPSTPNGVPATSSAENAVKCRGCGEPMDADVRFCPACGAARAPANPGRESQSNDVRPGTTHADDTGLSYERLPWYRKNGFAVVCMLSVPFCLLPVLLTGDSYYQRKGELRKFSKVAKGVIVAWGFLSLIYAGSQLFGSSVPKCSDKETKNLVLKIAREKLARTLMDPSAVQMSLGAIRTTDSNEKTGAQLCAAQLELSEAEGSSTSNITYKVEKTDKSGEMYVTVYGL